MTSIPRAIGVTRMFDNPKAILLSIDGDLTDDGLRALHDLLRTGWPAQSGAARDVLAERERQVSAEGWTPEHDDKHDDGSLALAGACYASNAATWASHGTARLRTRYAEISKMACFRWPWPREWWKPKDQRRDLVRAAALILAEIERLDRRVAQRAEPM